MSQDCEVGGHTLVLPSVVVTEDDITPWGKRYCCSTQGLAIAIVQSTGPLKSQIIKSLSWITIKK